jgi:hypothetical protein
MSGAQENTSFEVQVLQDKHWVIAEMAGDEGKAKAFLENLLQTGNHEAVRVVKDYRRIDGTHSETVVVEKKADQKAALPVQLSAITEAPPCSALADYYALPARLTMGRLLRKYFDEVFITPTELLHSAAELKRFGDKDRLLFSACDRVAFLQAHAAGEDGKTRREALDKAWTDINARAKAAAAMKLPAVKTLEEVQKAATAAGDQRDYVAHVLMCQALIEKRSWIGKVDLLLAWAAEPNGAEAMPMIDGVIADILVSAQFIQDLLGFQSNLAAALCSLCDLAEGKAEAAKFAPATFTALNKLFAEGRLPQCRQVLLSRVSRETAGTNPLSRNEPKQEYEMFHKVLHRQLGHQGVLGGPAAAEALLQRGARVYNAGGATLTAMQALDFMMSSLTEGCLKVQYLACLAESPLGVSMAEVLVEVLETLVRGAIHIDAWVPVRVPPRDRMAALCAANRAVRSGVLPDDIRKVLGNHIDEVLSRYLLDEQIIEKIDKPDDPLALRAIRLIKFCGSGVLIEGKSLDLARQRVIEHLKQKQFEEKFLASVPDPVQAEKHLREFHRLLVETGFR